MNLEQIEKYFENKFSEKLHVLSDKQKNINYIEDLDTKIIKETKDCDNFIIISPVRKRSFFENKCKYCKCGCIKDTDRFYYIKSESCYKCYVTYEER